MDFSCKSIIFPIDAFMEEISLVLTETYDFKYRDKSIITTLSIVATIRILMQKTN